MLLLYEVASSGWLTSALGDGALTLEALCCCLVLFRYHAGQPVGMLVAAIRSAAPLEKPPQTTMLEVLPIGREK